MAAQTLSVKPALIKTFLKLVVRPSLLTPNAMRVGREWKHIKLRPREAVGLFLVFAVGQFLDNENIWSIGSDPESGDGVVICVKGEKEGDAVAIEQVYVPSLVRGEISDLVSKMVEKKSAKGKEYARNRHLVIFCDKSGILDLAKVTIYLESQELFMSYWVIARVDFPHWNYLIAVPRTSGDPHVAYKVSIADNFSDWDVKVLGNLETLDNDKNTNKVR
jgi:hypothetical protein